MNAAQAAAEYYAMSGDGWNGHNSQVERDCRKKAGMTYGSMTNLTGSTSSNRSTVAKESVTNWVNSDVHFQAMIDATADNIGVGVAIDANGYFWCVQVLAIMNPSVKICVYSGGCNRRTKNPPALAVGSVKE